MSIPALNNTTDYDVYFKKYLKSLDLQNELNKKNFDANYAFRTTGVRETERPDMRPIEERMGDIEKLKVQARMMLNKVTDAKNANQVMEYLLKNEKILFYFVQNFPTFEEIAKRQYSGGVLASQMISILYRAYQKYSDEILIPDSDDYQLVTSLVTQQDLDEIKNRTQNRELKKAIYDNERKFLTKADIEEVTNSPEKYVDQIKEYANKYKDALTYDDINPLIEAYNDVKVNMDDSSEPTILSLEEKLIEILDDFQPPTIVNIPTKSSGPNLVLTRKEKPILVSEEEKLLKLQKRKEIILKNARKTAEILVKADTERSKKINAEKLRLQKIEQEKIEQEIEQEKLRLQKIEQVDQFPDEEEDALQFGRGFLDNREKSIHRFKVLKGELIAGNTSRSIIKELKSLVVKMIKINELEPPQALMILKELNNIK
jgi:hypothetical protein